ncbi:MAG: GNAT family N-acetyltransferase [Hyphomicrobiaceae bacterium]
MTELVTRRATPADAGLVRALTRSAYAKWVAVVGREPRPMTADYETAVVAHSIDLIEEGGVVVALIEMKAEADHLLIVNIAVHPDRHGQGLGSRLLRHAERVARDLGLPELRLYTNAKMEPNVALYESRGYSVTSYAAAGPLGIAVNMAKRLDG